jgi:hypothetical protein
MIQKHGRCATLKSERLSASAAALSYIAAGKEPSAALLLDARTAAPSSTFNHSNATMLAVLKTAAAKPAARLLQPLQVQNDVAGTCQAKSQPPAQVCQVAVNCFFVFVQATHIMRQNLTCPHWAAPALLM